MLSVEKTKELIDDKNISDEEAKKIRDDIYELAEIIFEKYQADKKAGKLPK